mgnify:FL=1
MGTISVNKLGGLALMAAPVITLIFFFLQPGGTFVDAADPADAGATIKAMVSNAGLGKVTSMLIPIGLLVFLYGIFVLQGNVRSNGNGDALSRIGAQFILVGVIGWVLASGAVLAITGSDLPAEQAASVFESLYSATVGIGTISGIISGIGFLALALALSTRDDYNKIFALVAAVAAVVAIVVGIISAIDTAQLQTMNLITGITYLVHMAWFFTLGRSLSQSE